MLGGLQVNPDLMRISYTPRLLPERAGQESQYHHGPVDGSALLAFLYHTSFGSWGGGLPRRLRGTGRLATIKISEPVELSGSQISITTVAAHQFLVGGPVGPSVDTFCIV